MNAEISQIVVSCLLGLLSASSDTSNQTEGERGKEGKERSVRNADSNSKPKQYANTDEPRQITKPIRHIPFLGLGTFGSGAQRQINPPLESNGLAEAGVVRDRSSILGLLASSVSIAATRLFAVPRRDRSLDVDGAVEVEAAWG